MREIKAHRHPLFRKGDDWMIDLREIVSIGRNPLVNKLFITYKSGREDQFTETQDVIKQLLDAWESYTNFSNPELTIK